LHLTDIDRAELMDNDPSVSHYDDMRNLTVRTQELFNDVTDFEKEIKKLRDSMGIYENKVSEDPSYADEVLEEMEGEDEENSFTITERDDYEHNQRNMRELTLQLHVAKLRFAQEKLFAIYERENAGWYLKDAELRMVVQDLENEVKREQNIIRTSKTNWRDYGEGAAMRRELNSTIMKKDHKSEHEKGILSVMESLHTRVSKLEALCRGII